MKNYSRRAVTLLLSACLSFRHGAHVHAVATQDCTKEFCEKQLSWNYLLRYQINTPTDTTVVDVDQCEDCTVTMELIYDGEAWVSIAFNEGDQMAGAEAVIGSPDFGPYKFKITSRTEAGVTPMPQSQQTLTDASVEVNDDGQTIMRFTKIMKEAGEVEIMASKTNIFLWAYGCDNTLGYHAANSAAYLKLYVAPEIDIVTIEPDSTVTVTAPDSSPVTEPYSTPVTVREPDTSEAVTESSTTTTETEPDSTAFDALQLSCPDTLDRSTQISSSATLYYAVVPSNPTGSGNGILCGRLEAISDGWAGLGFSRYGIMQGSEAIIGLPNGGEDVSKYDLSGYYATRLPESQQTLRDTSCAVDDDVDGKMIMTFTKLLVEEGEVPIVEDGQNTFLYAMGNSANVAHHDSQEVFTVDFSLPPALSADIEVGDKASSAKEPTPSPVTEPVIEPVEDCSTVFCENQLSPDYLLRYKINVPADTTEQVCEGCTISMEVTYNGEAWVSVGFTLDGQMTGSDAVIGSPDFAPQKYFMSSKATDGSGVNLMPESQQTLTDTSVEVKDGQTVMKFTKNMKESGEIEINTGDNILLWAHGSSNTLGYHAAKSVFELNLASGSLEEVTVAYKSAWFAHGIMAFLAWGVFVPFAVEASLLRSLLPKGPLWLKLHRTFNSVAFALFIIIFVIAVVYTQKENGTHFANPHQRMGLAMFILVFGQVLAGVFRPHNPDPGEEKTQLRKGWEIGHRVLGVALLACGFWQMSDGIRLFSLRYAISEDDEDTVTIAYWVWAGLMSAIIVIGGGYFKYRNVASSKDGDGAPPAAKH